MFHFRLQAENFTVTDPSCWKVGRWIDSDSYFTATFAGGYLSRGAFLGAPAVLGHDRTTCTAVMPVVIPKAGTFAALARYELQNGVWTTYFKIEIEQAGRHVFTKPYGFACNKECRASPSEWRGLANCNMPGPGLVSVPICMLAAAHHSVLPAVAKNIVLLCCITFRFGKACRQFHAPAVQRSETVGTGLKCGTSRSMLARQQSV